jgi:DNA-binding MarR family transcriptional regulator
VSASPRTQKQDLALTDDNHNKTEAYQFILEEIDTVPHLEALLLLWNTRPRSWSRQDLSERLYISPSAAQVLLQDLVRQGLAIGAAAALDQYSYNEESQEKNRVVSLVDAIYRKEVVRISTLIHSKPSSSLRDFARAFRFTKERE